MALAGARGRPGYLTGAEPSDRSGQAARLEGLTGRPFRGRPTRSTGSSCSPGSSSSCRRRVTTPRRTPTRRSCIASSRTRTPSRPSTPCGSRPSITRCAAIRRWSSCIRARARRRDRRVGGRGGPARLHPDRARSTTCRASRTIIATRPASTPPSSWPCATPASGTPSTATACSSPASLPAATWPGITAWPTPTCSPAWSCSRACPPSTCPGMPAAPRAAPAALRHRRAGPRGQRGHLQQDRQADDPEDVGRHLRRIPAPRPGDLPRGGPTRLRLDGPPSPRPVSQVVQGRRRPGVRQSVLRRRGPASSSPGRTTAPEAVDLFGKNLNPPRSR